jgi:hypothetical protein
MTRLQRGLRSDFFRSRLWELAAIPNALSVAISNFNLERGLIAVDG